MSANPLFHQTEPVLTFRRYTSRPFPAYRFVPGRNPHPTRDPAGHSFRQPGQPEPPAQFHPPERWHCSDEYLYGADLYNHAYWWEAHESWEALWQLTDKSGVQGRFLQGLIQTSACHLKILMGRTAGVRRLHTGSGRYLDSVLDRIDANRWMGLDLGDFRVCVDRYMSFVLSRADGPLRHDPATYPYIVLAMPG